MRTLTAIAALTAAGCATSDWAERRAELGCDDYGVSNLPGYAEYFGAEVMPTECLTPMPGRAAALGGDWEVVTIYDAGTGSTRPAIIPAGAVVVK